MSATALDMCHQARRAWERTQPQLFLELDDDGALEEHGSPIPSPTGFEPCSSSASLPREAPTMGAGNGALAEGTGTTGTDTSRSTVTCSPGKAKADLLSESGGARPVLINNNGSGRSPWTGGARPEPLEAHHA